MFRASFRVAFTLVTALSAYLSIAYGQDISPGSVAQSAVRELDLWLASTGQGTEWRSFLKTDQLQEQLARGGEADPAAVAEVIAQYSKDVAGMDDPRFQRARRAIRGWLEQLPAGNTADIRVAIEAAKSAFVPLTRADLDDARAQLESAIEQLNAELEAAGDVGEGWRDFLVWEKMQQELAKDEPDLSILDAVYLRYASGQKALNFTVFERVQKRLRQYLVIARAMGAEGLEDQYRQILDLLAEHVAAYSDNPNPADAQVISDAIRWLREAQQAGWIAEAVRRQFGFVNFYVRASNELMGGALSRSADEVTPVEDCILGTAIYGTGHAIGQLSVELIPSDTRAAIDLILRSTTRSETIGYNGPVRVHSDGVTQSASRKRLLVTADGLASLPAATNAITDSKTRGIDAGGRRLIEKVAWRKSAKQKGLSQQIAARHAEARISNRFNEQTAELVDDVNRNYREDLRRPLVRRGLFPSDLRFSTTDEALQAAAVQASADHHLAAPTAPPALGGESDLDVRVHESAINNFAEELFGGMIVTEEQLQQEITDLLGYLPDRLKSPEGEERWSITFPERQPVSVAFTSGGFSVSIRGVSYRKGESEYPGMNVTAGYEIRHGDGQVRAVRRGDLEIFPPGFSPDEGKRLSTREQVLRNMLERRFNEVFPQEIVPEPIVPKGKRLSNLGKLVLQDWQTTAGWMVLGWDRVPAEPAAE